MKFEFSFEKILQHRRGLEDVARRDWLVAQANLNKALKELDEMFAQIETARFRAGQLALAGGTHGAQLVMIDDFIRGQKIRIELKRAKVRELMGEAERLQDILVEAAREKKILEKLKERRLEEYRRKRKKLELKAVDELVVTRAKFEQFGFSSPLKPESPNQSRNRKPA